MTVALSFDHVSKHYRGARRYAALRDDLMGAMRRLLWMKPPASAVVRALDDLSFQVPEGQSFGIIGPNGAGKTTMLKLATRITYPTAGNVRIRGRVGALLEVGTGMHPELTGRENIGLYGRILGFSKRDINRRFDDIVDFAGVGAALDQPVKQYSSGMQLRLGFSVAAHLEPDVLLVDEAIAVGDAGFQYRCVERMAALVREGRTLVFVSHDMSAVETLCQRAILLQAGQISCDGPARSVVRQYLLAVQTERLAATSCLAAVGEDLEIVRVSIHDARGEETAEVQAHKPMTVRVHYRVPRPVTRPIFSIGLSDGRLGCFALASMLVDGQGPDVISGEGHVDCVFADLPLQPKVYEVWGSVRGQVGFGDLVDWQRLGLFRVRGGVNELGRSAVAHSLDDAPVKIPYRWLVGNGEVQ
jgi:ABC-type polysaccharide/polyol phosphate transport system ATPase subunit